MKTSQVEEFTQKRGLLYVGSLLQHSALLQLILEMCNILNEIRVQLHSLKKFLTLKLSLIFHYLFVCFGSENKGVFEVKV